MTALIFVLLAALRVVHFTGGTATIAPLNDGTQRVTIKDAKGAIEAQSECDSQSGTYDQIVKFGQAVVAAARANDRAAIMALVQYPLRVNVTSSNHFFVKNAASLKAQYETVFTSSVIGLLRQIEPHGAFCREGMSMYGSGILWATVDKRGALKAAVVNQ